MFDVSPGGQDEDPNAASPNLARPHEQTLQPPVQYRIQEPSEKHLLGQRRDRDSKNHHQIHALRILEKLVHGQRFWNRQQPRKLSQGHREKGACRKQAQPARTARPPPPHGLPERTLLVTSHQPIHSNQHGHVRQRHAGHNHQRPGVLPQLSRRHAMRERAMQDNDESDQR